MTDIANRLDRDVAGDDLFLLALLELPPGTVARRVLEAAGATTERVAAEIRTEGDGPAIERHGVSLPPAFNSMEGRAVAFAASLGDGAMTPEFVLLALIWDPVSQASQLLWRLGVSRERLMDGLRAEGVPLPSAPLPEQDEIEVGERVWFDRADLSRVIDRLRKDVPAGTHWGFNYEADRAWVMAESHVDLEAVVARALAEPSS